MTAPKLNPKNDLAFVATIRVVNASGNYEPLDEGTPTAFLATSSASTATAADVTLVSTPTFTGKAGKWLVKFESDVLTPALLSSLFAAATPWVVIEFAEGVRVAIECAYEDAKLVVVT